MMTERANTIKAYILRDSKAVEPQNPTRDRRLIPARESVPVSDPIKNAVKKSRRK
jgi:hypothetical protein